MKINQKGMLLADLFTAILICSLSGLLVIRIFVPAVKIQSNIYAKWNREKDLRMLHQQMKEDWQHMVELKDNPFSGNEKEINFRVRVKKENGWEWQEIKYLFLEKQLARKVFGLNGDKLNSEVSDKNYNLKGSFNFLFRNSKNAFIYKKRWKKNELRAPRTVKVWIGSLENSEELLLNFPGGIVPLEKRAL